MARTLPQDCRPRNRCHNWRDCAQCARIRQARIATRAEALLADHQQLKLFVVKPYDTSTAGMQRAIKSVIRKNGLTAGIWTIERGQKAGTIHANILTHDCEPKPHKSADQHVENVRTGARVTAAYISKQSQAPEREHYSGKTFGSWGKASEFLIDPKMPVIVTAAAIEIELGGLVVEPGLTEPARQPQTPKGSRKNPREPFGRALEKAGMPADQWSGIQLEPIAEPTLDDYRAIAARHLPHLAALSASFNRRLNSANIP